MRIRKPTKRTRVRLEFSAVRGFGGDGKTFFLYDSKLSALETSLRAQFGQKGVDLLVSWAHSVALTLDQRRMVANG